MLKTEVLACGYIGCKELIVHLKQHKLTAVEVKSLSDLLKFAKKNKVEILYEPNSNFDGRNYLYNLKKVPPLNANLDLCHLAMALENKTLGMDLREFLKKVRDRVVYVHASGYDGVTDHIGLRKGKLDWIDVLDQLNMSKIRKIIIELHDFGDFKETKKAIDSYVRKR
jgi:sugar phosphate isomerase/epimerase